MKEQLMDKIEFATKELESIEPRELYDENCKYCNGRGVMYVPDGYDDVVAEICYCVA